MSEILLNESHYDAVRAALDPALVSNNSGMPDSIIQQDMYAWSAINDVVERVSTAASKTGDELKRCQVAAQYFCAARLAKIYRPETSISVSARDANYAQPAFKSKERSEDLFEMALQELRQVDGYTTSVESPRYSVVDATRTDAWT